MTVTGLPGAIRGSALSWRMALTACSQGQASRAASNEVVQGVIWLLSDLGTDTAGKAKHSSDGSCEGQWQLEVLS